MLKRVTTASIARKLILDEISKLHAQATEAQQNADCDTCWTGAASRLHTLEQLQETVIDAFAAATAGKRKVEWL